mgnify:CR=1 FL=1
MSILKKTILLLGDIIVLYISLIITIVLRYDLDTFFSRFAAHLGPFSLLFLLWILVFYIADFYVLKTFKNRGVLAGTIIRAVLITTTLSMIFFYLFGDSFFRLTPKTNLFIFSGVFTILDFLLRRSLIQAFASGAINTVIIGNTPRIKEIIAHVKENPHSGYSIAHWMHDPQTINFQKLRELLRETSAGLVVIHPHLTKDFSMTNLAYRLLALEVNIMNSLDFYETLFEKEALDEASEEWFIHNITPRKPFYDTIKRLIDIFLATLISIPFLPFFILIMLIMPFTSRKGPVIYKQERLGKNGKPFMLYKFGTMNHDDDGPLATVENDVRITIFGKMLRFTHFDELPQLINILKGDISFTGPRPERSELVKEYSALPYYEIRHVVKPGLTGWAQINYRPSATPEEAYEKLRYDMYYIKNRSLLLDLLIILKTAKYIFTTHKPIRSTDSPPVGGSPQASP